MVRRVLAVAALVLMGGCGPQPAECVRVAVKKTWEAAPPCVECAERIVEAAVAAKQVCSKKGEPHGPSSPDPQ